MQKRRKKSTFGPAGLPVSKTYLFPPSRRGLWLIGGGAVIVLAVLVALDYSFDDAALLSGGPLSSAHANLDRDCAACHTAFAELVPEKCATCHEKYGDELGVYSFASHYLYRSGDFQRVVPSPDEMPCADCHPEHGGRQAQITRVADSQCTTCHEFGSFNRNHPNFAALARADDGALKFPHIRHVREIAKEEGLADIERTCLYCHNPTPDGTVFEPINFERHCDSCHLTTTVSTPRLPIASADRLGVSTLAAIRERHEPGSNWTYYTNPGEFREIGGRLVSKSPLYHRDPWIMSNLRRLRRMLYPDAGLADLLDATPEVSHQTFADLYREAVDNLQNAALELRSRPEPEVQDELNRIDGLLTKVNRALEDPYTPLDETEFALALQTVNPELSAEQVSEIEDLANSLTEPCRQCHLVEKATIARVQASQKTLHAADFNHRAHILQRRCLDCHNQIPIREYATTSEKVPAELDRAEIQNLPGIEDCRTCHNPNLADNRCITCHAFHPDQSRRSDLLLYLD